jgi:hypothetical protein
MLAYGQVIDASNEYCSIRENTSHECLKYFCENDQGSFLTQILQAIDMNRFGKTNENECK